MKYQRFPKWMWFVRWIFRQNMENAGVTVEEVENYAIQRHGLKYWVWQEIWIDFMFLFIAAEITFIIYKIL